jgi:hypothetical protein
LLEILAANGGAAASAAASALAPVADLDGLGAVGAWYKTNAATAGVPATMSNFLYYVASGLRFKDDAAGQTAIRKAIDALLKDKGLTPYDKGYTMDTLAALGGPKSVATCGRFAKDKDEALAAKAKACVEKAKAAK